MYNMRKKGGHNLLEGPFHIYPLREVPHMPTVTVHLPASLQAFTDHCSQVCVNGNSVKSCLEDLVSKYPDLRAYLFAPDHSLCSFTNVYLNGEDIRFLDHQHIELSEGSNLSIIPSMAGG